ncbi:hypothetical protein O181_005106 [Austropuccinia psidii MF-1]|uniref:Uncharacterized protein n=1 Tax=Austropuccinia psidii MF-1 TaxID=1389203 RepID=A0A9Q3BGQ1_9BASI|nr:hypothetical protein [Austropuccinia psidii MF-1]
MDLGRLRWRSELQAEDWRRGGSVDDDDDEPARRIQNPSRVTIHDQSQSAEGWIHVSDGPDDGAEGYSSYYLMGSIHGGRRRPSGAATAEDEKPVRIGHPHPSTPSPSTIHVVVIPSGSFERRSPGIGPRRRARVVLGAPVWGHSRRPWGVRRRAIPMTKPPKAAVSMALVAPSSPRTGRRRGSAHLRIRYGSLPPALQKLSPNVRPIGHPWPRPDSLRNGSRDSPQTSTSQPLRLPGSWSASSLSEPSLRSPHLCRLIIMLAPFTWADAVPSTLDRNTC